MEINLFVRMVNAAARLNEPDKALTINNGEYLRGQAELICDVAGVNMDQREDLMNLILQRADELNQGLNEEPEVTNHAITNP